MTKVPFVDLGIQYQAIRASVDAAVLQTLAQCNFILGPQVEEFERRFAGFCGVPHAVGLSNGLDALRLSLAALDIGPGHEVIVQANTYIATTLAVCAVGARPVLVDCEPATYGIDVTAIAAALTPRTRAIMPVHLMGHAADLDPILALARQHNLHVIEDAAQAHGTLYKQRPCGSLGVTGCFSFYPGKNLGAYGDGGLVTTHDAAVAERLRRLRNYGQRAKYEHVEKGVNARLDTLQAAILNVKLDHLSGWNAARARHAARYRELLHGVGDLAFQQTAPYSTHIYHLFVVETARRDALQKHLTAAGIQTGIHYPRPVHLQAAHADLGYRAGDFPQAEQLAGRMLSLPMFPELTPEQLEYVVQEVKSFFARA